MLISYQPPLFVIAYMVTVLNIWAQEAVLRTSFFQKEIREGDTVKLSITLMDPITYSPLFKGISCGCILQASKEYLPLAMMGPRETSLRLVRSSETAKKIPDLIVRLAIERSKTLTIQKVTRLDEGLVWKCFLKYLGSGGEKTLASPDYKIVTVYDFGKLSISREGLQFSQEGESFNATCQVEGYPKPLLVWYKDDQDTTTLSRYISTNKTSGEKPDMVINTLTISKVNLKDTGRLECRMKQKGNEQSASFTLLVEYFHGITSNQQTTTEVIEEEQLQLSCQSNGFPRPNITWEWNGNPVQDSKAIEIRYNNVSKTIINSTVLVKKAETATRGLYICKSSNRLGKALFNFSVNVLYFRKPRLDVNSQLARESGSFLAVQCDCQGNPPPTIRWTKNSDPIHQGIKNELNGHTGKSTLLIQALKPADAANYTCYSKSSIGEEQAGFILHVVSSSDSGRSHANNLLLYSPLIASASALALVIIVYIVFKQSKKRESKRQVTPQIAKVQETEQFRQDKVVFPLSVSQNRH